MLNDRNNNGFLRALIDPELKYNRASMMLTQAPNVLACQPPHFSAIQALPEQISRINAPITSNQHVVSQRSDH
jgi:hypothetical protein